MSKRACSQVILFGTTKQFAIGSVLVFIVNMQIVAMAFQAYKEREILWRTSMKLNLLWLMILLLDYLECLMVYMQRFVSHCLSFQYQLYII